MFFLGLDLETTGLDVKKDRIIEVGLVVYCTIRKKPLAMLSHLIRDETIGPLSDEIKEITGIDDWDLKEFGEDPKKVLGIVREFIERFPNVVAHNGRNFDIPFLYNEYDRFSLRRPNPFTLIDTSTDVPYPEMVGTRKLGYLAAEHGFLNPFPHRAVTDVLTMLKVVGQYDTSEVIKWALAPNLKVRAVVTYDDRQKAKDLGYRWEAGEKLWVKTLKNFQLEAERERADFEVRVLEEGSL